MIDIKRFKYSFRSIPRKTKITTLLIIGLILIVFAILYFAGVFKSPINKTIEVSQDGVHLYVNTNQDFTARFGYLSEGKYQHLVQYEANTKEKITMQLLNTNEGIKVSKTTTTNPETKSTDNIDIIRFENVFKSVYVYYQITNTRIKEVIALIDLEAPVSYTYSVATSGVTLEKVNDGKNGYIFKSGNKTVFGLPALFMKDSKNEISYNVETKITFEKEENGESIYKLEVIPEVAWLKAEGRAFPVLIDPSIVNMSN